MNTEITSRTSIRLVRDGAGPRRLAKTLGRVRRVFGSFWRGLVTRARRAPKTLVLLESSALGDRRFAAVVQFERQRFLIGSSPSSVSLLARLPDADPGPKIEEGGSAPGGGKQ